MRELLKPVVSTALEVAILVKCLPNIKQAAELIEDYARSVASKARMDENDRGIEIPASKGQADDQ